MGPVHSQESAKQHTNMESKFQQVWSMQKIGQKQQKQSMDGHSCQRDVQHWHSIQSVGQRRESSQWIEKGDGTPGVGCKNGLHQEGPVGPRQT